MKVYVAFRTDVDPPTRMASPSFTKLKGAMKGETDLDGNVLKPKDRPDMVGAEFTVVLYDFKPNVTNLCQAIMDVTELDADSATDYRINDQGQLREVK